MRQAFEAYVQRDRAVPGVMAGLVPAIHVLLADSIREGVDARHKAGHDEGKFPMPSRALT